MKNSVKKQASLEIKEQGKKIVKEWNENNRSLSALCKYAKTGLGKEETQILIDIVNAKNGTKIDIAQVCNTKNIVKYATDRDLNFNANKDKEVLNEKGAKLYIKGEAKRFFPISLINKTVARLSNAAKA